MLVEWQPVRIPNPIEIDRAEIERRASELSLQPVRWPAQMPTDSTLAMLAATYAKQIGRAVSFSLAAFRQAFAAGRDLALKDTVLIVGAACEIHPTALLRAVERESIARGLAQATADAQRLGVRRLPAIACGGKLFQGERALEQAVEKLRASA